MDSTPDKDPTTTQSHKLTSSKLVPGPKNEIGIIKALAKCSEQIRAVGKDKKNIHFNFMYRSIDAIVTACHDVLAKQSVVPTIACIDYGKEERTEQKNGKEVRLTRRIGIHEVTFWHEDGSSLVIGMIGSSMDGQDKAFTKMQSIVLKYALTSTLLIPHGAEDPDGSGNEHKEVKPATAAQTKKILELWNKYRESLTDIEDVEKKSDDVLFDLLKKHFRKEEIKSLNSREASKFIKMLLQQVDELKKKQTTQEKVFTPEEIKNEEDGTNK